MMNETQIERRGETTGRKINYLLIVNGVSMGRVKRKNVSSGGVLLPKTRTAVWEIFGLQVATQQEAEQELIARARREGRF